MIPERLFGVEILLKSKIEKCEKHSDLDRLDCKQKIVVNLAVPSRSSGGESSIVAELVETEDNATHQMQTIRTPPIITVNKSAAYALYEITYIRDVPFKAEEHTVRTRKCEPDASAKIVKSCERLKDQSVVDTLLKGKANTAHCLRFSQDWFHVFEIGRRSLGFNVRIQVKKGTKTSEVVVGPANRTALSNDNFLRVHLFGDFVGYTSIPSFEDLYLVIPRQGSEDRPQNLGRNFSMWMLLERPDFCSGTLGSCLHNQLRDFWHADQYEIENNLLPQYRVEGRFERINEHPGR
ncbi:hypothetical protein H6P81_016017 [Aristolochia fimbriata]|uniref:Generative cell specific-1/HAP2 domain-containing protein n=1 Tax=Aristolochia fimbriata TaxID=158543 RepID=A0AAV7EAB1_ARIFI|nr:hypothetical protein H6P81_016017 [Aristolochia fimbriata]